MENYLRLKVSTDRKARQEFVRMLRFPKPKAKEMIILWRVD